MGQKPTVYDLGEVKEKPAVLAELDRLRGSYTHARRPAPRPEPATRRRRAGRAGDRGAGERPAGPGADGVSRLRRWAAALPQVGQRARQIARLPSLPSLPRRPGPTLTASLSVLCPGAGQAVAGEAQRGLLLLSWLGLFAASQWALLATFDRLVPALALLGVPDNAPVVLLAALHLAAAVLYVGGVVHAHTLGTPAAEPDPVPPLTAAAASLAVPGWGQLLNGNRRRGAMFLCGVWALLGAWPLLDHPLHPLVRGVSERILGTSLPEWSRTILLGAAALLWSLAIYDAFTQNRRRRA